MLGSGFTPRMIGFSYAMCRTLSCAPMIHWAITLTLLMTTTLHAATHYHVYILSGQSNMDGRGKKSELVGQLAQWAKPQSDVLITYSNSTLRGPYKSEGWKPLEPGYSVPPG